MISQKIPVAAKAGFECAAGALRPVAPLRECFANHLGENGNSAGHGSLRIQLHLAPRCEGPRLDPGSLSRSARPRRLRWPLLLPGAGPARGGRRRQCAARRDRDADQELSSLFGRARRLHAFALRDERDLEDRRRGEGDPLRCAQDSCRDRRSDLLRRTRPQIPDLGARTLPRAARGGHRGGARVEEATGLPGGGARRAQSTGMMAGRDEDVAGGPARHIPLLARQGLGGLAPAPGGIYIDGTFGPGGHTRGLLEAGATVIGIDRDRAAVAGGFELVEQSGGRLTLVEDRFSHLDHVARGLGHDAVDGILFDLGVSSMQLDQAERGFSFRHEGPLDMRMGGEGESAADLVNSAGERDLAAIIATLGEERFARPIARAIVKARSEDTIATTAQLADIVGAVVHARPGQIHPATRTFQALRMFVNDELGELAAALSAAERMLKPGGRLAVISFHSLEDRIVKTFLAERGRIRAASRHQPDLEKRQPSFRILTRKPMMADDPEVASNPRARSAKLRAAERTDAPPAGGDLVHLLPRLPSLADAMRAR